MKKKEKKKSNKKKNTKKKPFSNHVDNIESELSRFFFCLILF